MYCCLFCRVMSHEDVMPSDCSLCLNGFGILVLVKHVRLIKACDRLITAESPIEQSESSFNSSTRYFAPWLSRLHLCSSCKMEASPCASPCSLSACLFACSVYLLCLFAQQTSDEKIINEFLILSFYVVDCKGLQCNNSLANLQSATTKSVVRNE